MSIKIEWVVIAVLTLALVYVLSTQREHMDTPPAEAVTTCPSGYAYDAVAKTCNPVNEGQGAGPIAGPESGTSSSPAPVVVDGPITNTGPMVTPTATMPPVTPSPEGPVTPATTSSSTPARS
jgi:hypothetical protein